MELSDFRGYSPMTCLPERHSPQAYLIAGLAGTVFALLVWRISALEPRFAVAAVGALLVIACAMIFIYRIEDFLVYALIANIPFAAFEKWIFVQPIAVPAKGLTLGLSELLLLLAYSSWFCRVFVTRSSNVPSFTRIDLCMAFLFLTQLISLVGAPDKSLAAFDIVYNLRHFLIYFYLAQHVERRHLKWIVVLFLGAILLESAVAGYERITGNVGIGLSKGNVASEDFGRQYRVPGSEEYRAAGTTNDSHTLALYYAMVLPVPLILMFLPSLRRRSRIIMAATLMIGCTGLIVTFSRSGWLSFAIASSLASLFMLVVWKRTIIIPVGICFLALATLLFPKTYSYVMERIVNAPPELLEVRYDSYWTALDIWKGHMLFGYGPGNYIEALSDTTIRSQSLIGDWDVEVPVHNAFLWIAAELGLFGVICFFGMILLTIARAIPLLKNDDPLVKGLSLAILTALGAYLLDGLTDPMFREATPYAQLWVYLGLAMAIRRFAGSDTAPSPNPLPEEKLCASIVPPLSEPAPAIGIARVPGGPHAG